MVCDSHREVPHLLHDPRIWWMLAQDRLCDAWVLEACHWPPLTLDAILSHNSSEYTSESWKKCENAPDVWCVCLQVASLQPNSGSEPLQRNAHSPIGTFTSSTLPSALMDLIAQKELGWEINKPGRWNPGFMRFNCSRSMATSLSYQTSRSSAACCQLSRAFSKILH